MIEPPDESTSNEMECDMETDEEERSLIEMYCNHDEGC